MIREPGKEPTRRTIIATKGREVVIENQTGQLLRRNRKFVSQEGPPQDYDSGVTAPSTTAPLANNLTSRAPSH